MRADNVVLLFTLVWALAVCQDNRDISVSCDDVIGFVRTEVNLSCSVTLMKTECCILMYKFQYPERFNEAVICRQELPLDSCVQRNSFTCSFTSTTAMTEQFRLFVLTPCGQRSAEFSVIISEPRIDKPEDRSNYAGATNPGSNAVVSTAVGLSVVILLIIIISVTVIYLRRCKSTGRERGVPEEQTVMTSNV